MCLVNNLPLHSVDVTERVEPYLYSPLDLYGLFYGALYINNLRINMPHFLALAIVIILIGRKILFLLFLFRALQLLYYSLKQRKHPIVLDLQ